MNSYKLGLYLGQVSRLYACLADGVEDDDFLLTRCPALSGTQDRFKVLIVTVN